MTSIDNQYNSQIRWYARYEVMFICTYYIGGGCVTEGFQGFPVFQLVSEPIALPHCGDVIVAS